MQRRNGSDSIAFAVKKEANTNEIANLNVLKISKKCLTIEAARCKISELRLIRTSQRSRSDAGRNTCQPGFRNTNKIEYMTT